MTVCSKFVHSTGYSVMCPPKDDHYFQIAQPIFVVAAHATAAAMEALNTRLNQLEMPAFKLR